MASRFSAHPVERGEPGRGRFDGLSQHVSHIASSAWFFVFCVAMIVAWGAAFALGASGSLRDLLSESMTALTLLLVALLKNTDLRAEAAIQLKLDGIAAALAEQHEGRDPRPQLQEAIGLHDEL